ncbi:hypothetical protein WJX77_011606 [Trebouxia sp. C0004]
MRHDVPGLNRSLVPASPDDLPLSISLSIASGGSMLPSIRGTGCCMYDCQCDWCWLSMEPTVFLTSCTPGTCLSRSALV